MAQHAQQQHEPINPHVLKSVTLVQVTDPSKLPYPMANLGDFMGFSLHKDFSAKGVSYNTGILSDEFGDLQSAVGDIGVRHSPSRQPLCSWPCFLCT